MLPRMTLLSISSYMGPECVPSAFFVSLSAAALPAHQLKGLHLTMERGLCNDDHAAICRLTSLDSLSICRPDLTARYQIYGSSLSYDDASSMLSCLNTLRLQYLKLEIPGAQHGLIDYAPKLALLQELWLESAPCDAALEALAHCKVLKRIEVYSMRLHEFSRLLASAGSLPSLRSIVVHSLLTHAYISSASWQEVSALLLSIPHVSVIGELVECHFNCDFLRGEFPEICLDLPALGRVVRGVSLEGGALRGGACRRLAAALPNLKGGLGTLLCKRLLVRIAP